jgi:hypothetical protein|tara:strand:- start:300 stop:998 length:699 start_codon:yes stop_codon:yes gene_type:complete
MAYQSIGLGAVANDGSGDTLRDGATKVNANFVELYTALGNGSSISSGISASATVVSLSAPNISGVVAGTQTSATITTLTSTTVNAGTLALAAGSITDSSGAISFGNENISTTGTATLATVDINAGAIDGTTIGANSAAAGTFAAITGSSLAITEDGTIIFEGATDDGNETTLTVTDPTADRTITLPNETGTVITTGSSDAVTGNMLKSSSTLLIVNSSGSTLKTVIGAGSAS